MKRCAALWSWSWTAAGASLASFTWSGGLLTFSCGVVGCAPARKEWKRFDELGEVAGCPPPEGLGAPGAVSPPYIASTISETDWVAEVTIDGGPSPVEKALVLVNWSAMTCASTSPRRS